MSTSGYLYRQFGVLKAWKKFYCVLSNNVINEYVDKNLEKVSETIIDKDSQFSTNTEAKKPYCFKLKKGDKFIIYHAENEKVFSDWISQISLIYNNEKNISNNSKTNEQKTKTKVSLDDFHIIKVIGRGYYGKVFLVRYKGDGKLYALKAMSKAKIAEDNIIKQILEERNILFQNQHPFLTKAFFTFQTDAKVFIVLEYIPGGELFTRLKEEGKFSERRAQLYAAELVLGIGHLHQHGILYRDLKPENILVDSDGHLKITDFGFAKSFIKKEGEIMTSTFCGTPEYLPPEVFRQLPYSRSVDWWSLGVILFEMLSGYQPFYNENPQKMCKAILFGKVEYPNYFSANAKDLCSKLLEKDPKRRIGSGPTDAEEIKKHDFFIGINWNNVINKKTKPRWIPTISNDVDTSNFDDEFTKEPTNVSYCDPSLVPEEAQFAFQGFTLNADEQSII